ncbi:MAG: beta-L-arabinofuranosidase domain-containing protein [Anaerolineae bacterium]|jgi:hypothetical protein|nr:hypothetical protein [Chloroflexota bacterium]
MVVEQAGLMPAALEPLRLGELLPEGWLARQLRIQAEGLSGHLAEFWPDIADSGWIGGLGEGWERGPYWLDGLVPLAFLLQDDGLIALARRWMDEVLARQSPDGWLGPRQDVATGRYKPLDPWPVAVFVKAALQWQEATADRRVLPALLRYYRRLEEQLQRTPLFDWGRMRWPEIALGIQETFVRSGERWLLPLAETVRRQGFDWAALFAHYPYTGRTTRQDISMATHVVNNAMALKAGAIAWRQSGDLADLLASQRMLDLLEAYHGQVTGVFTGDEHLAGKSPSQGTELCAVVEMMYSLEFLQRVAPSVERGDLLERVAFNALPATFKPDMWAHQYDQQVNQPVCQVVPEPIYTNNAPESNIYGLEPNYGCCTANMHQGWPRYAASAWMRRPACSGRPEHLVALSYVPCCLCTQVAGTPVEIRVQTEYPFEGTVRVTVMADSPLRMGLELPVPRWAASAQLILPDGRTLALTAGSWHVLEQEWCGRSELLLELEMGLRVETRHRGAASILYGPLVMALEIGEEWRLIGGEPPHGDWEVHPTTPWNMGLVLDRAHPQQSLEVHRRPMGETPFSPEGVPLYALVQGAPLAQWVLQQGTAGPVPESPAASGAPLRPLRLIPYGATNLRIAEFPTLAAENLAAGSPIDSQSDMP